MVVGLRSTGSNNMTRRSIERLKSIDLSPKILYLEPRFCMLNPMPRERRGPRGEPRPRRRYEKPLVLMTATEVARYLGFKREALAHRAEEGRVFRIDELLKPAFVGGPQAIKLWRPRHVKRYAETWRPDAPGLKEELRVRATSR